MRAPGRAFDVQQRIGLDPTTFFSPCRPIRFFVCVCALYIENVVCVCKKKKENEKPLPSRLNSF